jgi:hypothetical protein
MKAESKSKRDIHMHHAMRQTIHLAADRPRVMLHMRAICKPRLQHRYNNTARDA